MRVSREQAARNRERIIEQAALLFREHGIDGIGVADLMQSAGLTHGGFYAHFASREALVVEAFVYAMDRSIVAWRKKTEAMPPAERFAAVVEGYLSVAHRDDPGRGCALPALAAEIGRESLRTRRAFAAKFEEMVEMLAAQISDASAEAAREQATAALATMVGTLILARVGGSGKLSDDILAAGRNALLSKAAPLKVRPKRPATKNP